MTQRSDRTLHDTGSRQPALGRWVALIAFLLVASVSTAARPALGEAEGPCGVTLPVPDLRAWATGGRTAGLEGALRAHEPGESEGEEESCPHSALPPQGRLGPLAPPSSVSDRSVERGDRRDPLSARPCAPRAPPASAR